MTHAYVHTQYVARVYAHTRPLSHVCTIELCWAMERFSIDSCVRGYHDYNDIWEASVGEELPCQRKYAADPYAVAIKGAEWLLGTYQEEYPQFVPYSWGETEWFMKPRSLYDHHILLGQPVMCVCWVSLILVGGNFHDCQVNHENNEN